MSINDIVERIKAVRALLPAEKVWNNWSEGNRGRAILNLLDADGDRNGDNGVYNAFVDAHHKRINSGIKIDLTFEYPILLELFDLAETL